MNQVSPERLVMRKQFELKVRKCVAHSAGAFKRVDFEWEENAVKILFKAGQIGGKLVAYSQTLIVTALNKMLGKTFFVSPYWNDETKILEIVLKEK